ncbi:MAG: AGE family epimerase/isomerase [Alicyclobacillus macrosporangiidus]|uniref:AGE family epimerase/isomerase n=1 Tax=Alicyclobacillus macrosporangiidus TaxID=392015 RepID=UPI0026F097F1|nr:AGE family epimerase/isomerase [Alicyclobacillus macrosporangiidus]MCL6600500.1 AGE family epimerase/isomerase [Alicyclobacillus macrosporangiidus]
MRTTQDLRTFYEEHLHTVLLPFWRRAVDPRHGGVYTCFNNDGTVLVSRDKYTWSQGRFAWLWSTIARLAQAGVLSVPAEPFLEQAGRTVAFLQRHAILPNGNCAYLLTEDGTPKEAIPGAGHDISFYADCFVILGFTGYARASGDEAALEDALRLYDHVAERARAGNLRTEPYPIPPGMRAHAVPMILVNVTQELLDLLVAAGHPRAGEMRDRLLRYAEDILATFMQPDGRVAEILPARAEDDDTVLCRHLNPGHTIEDMGFLLRAAGQTGRTDWIAPALRAIRKAFDLGWDDVHGGLFRFVDRDGSPPSGRRFGDRYEQLILDTWDMKLWWPHAEALYATLLAHQVTGAEDMRRLYDRTHAYVFRTFPNPDPEVGEWVQIRDRSGRPADTVVALPVKDPFHILRSVLLILERLAEEETSR